MFFAYWSAVRPMKHPVLATVALGLAVSLTIEVLAVVSYQLAIPARRIS